MIFLHRWKFFSNRGNDLNLSKNQKISVKIIDTTGDGAKFQAITNNAGDLVFLEIINAGANYTAPVIEITDNLTSTVHTIPFADITLDINNGIDSIVLGSPTVASWTYPSFTYSGNMYFSETISTSLIENEHVFIVEEIKDPAPPNNLGYVYPRYSGANGDIRWKWTDKLTDEGDKEALYIFTVDTESSLTPFISKVDNFDLDLDNGSADPTTTGKLLWRSIVDSNDSSAQMNIALSYPDEGVFERSLELYDYTDPTNPVLLAEILVSGEVIPEDERFSTILTNLGQQISQEEEFIFRDSDINEDLPNFKILNEKRKEFILEHANITPYIGSYKALFNVINWLGYNDLTIKEYWLNVAEGTPNYKKYKPIAIPFDLAQKGGDYKSAAMLPSRTYKKTNLFGLYYDINRESGEFDQFGLPETEDAFMFTPEEVLIKLFALKNYLKEKFLPLNARIIDIIGEGIYFERYRVNSWSDGTRVIDVDLTRDAKFTCTPHDPTIIDLRLLEDYNFFQPAQLTGIINRATGELVDIGIISSGFGYSGTVDIIIHGGAPTVAATATATLNPTTGGIATVTINPGSIGYGSIPVIEVSPEPTLPKASTLISDIQSRLTGFYDGINNLSVFPDEPNIQVGAPITLTTSSFDITWDEIQYPWNSFYYDFRPATAEPILNGAGTIIGFNITDPGKGFTSTPTVTLIGGSPITPGNVSATVTNGEVTSLNLIGPNFGGLGYSSLPTVDFIGGIPVSVLNTWDTIGIGDFYEMEWIVTSQENSQFNYRKRGRVDELREHVVILPYTGKYDVELVLYDTDNNWTNQIEAGCVDVKLPEVEFSTFGRFGQCYTQWDDLDMTWDEANYMWIHPIKHDVTWDDLDVTWDDLDMKSYTNQTFNLFPEILEKEILRLTETDRYLGNLSDIDFNTNQITVQDPVIQPRVETGDFLYFRQDDNIFRTQVVTADFNYTVGSATVNLPGTFTLQKDFSVASPGTVSPATSWGPYTPQERPIIEFSAPPSGVTAQGTVIIDGSIISAAIGSALGSVGNGYVLAFDPITGVSTGFPPTSFSGPGTYEYQITFSNPLDPLGTVATGWGQFNLTGEFVQWLDTPGGVGIAGPIIQGSGYNAPTNSYTIFDASGDIVDNTIGDDDLVFNVSVQGGVSSITIINVGSGYLSPPTATVYPTLGAATITPVLNNIADVGVLTVTNIPQGVNIKWDILREVGRTVTTQGNCIFNADTNPGGIKIGDWLKLMGADDVPKEEAIVINNEIFDSVGILSGINLSGDKTNFRVGEKCTIYRQRNLVYGTGSGADEFSVDDVNNQITIYSPTFDPIAEIIPGFHELVLNNWNGTTFDYQQRVLVIHINQVGNDYVLDVDAIDGDLGLFNSNPLSEIGYQFFDFPAVIDETILLGPTTDIILNLNDWPAHDTFSPSTETWYIDYGIVSGDWSLLVTDIGLEGNTTIISVDDPNSELWRSSTSYMLGWRPFDEDYAERRYGTDILSWENMNEVTWEDMCHLTWDMMEYKNYNYCGFRINKVEPSGRIQWNEESVFEFQGITGAMTTAQKLNQAVLELNQTDNTGLSRFGYTAMPDSTNPTYIMSTSYTPGGDALGYIRFTNGCEGEYSTDPTLSHTFPLNNTDNPLWTSGYYGPNNKPADWDPTIRAYNEWGVDPAGEIGWYPSQNLPKVYQSTQDTWKSDRIPYLHALGGPLTWSETYVSPRNSEVPIYSTMFFTASSSEMAGKTTYLWRIYDASTGEILMESIKPYLIWTFSKVGEFDVELEIKDTNRNMKSKRRKGFIKTYKPSL